MTGNQWLVKTDFHKQNLKRCIDGMTIPECGVYFEWYEADTKRSLQANKLLWVGAYQPIAVYLSDKTGNHYTKDMIHAVCKEKFLEPILVPAKDGVKKYPGSTRKLGKKAFNDYLEQVWSWGAEMGVYFE